MGAGLLPFFTAPLNYLVAVPQRRSPSLGFVLLGVVGTSKDRVAIPPGLYRYRV